MTQNGIFNWGVGSREREWVDKILKMLKKKINETGIKLDKGMEPREF